MNYIVDNLISVIIPIYNVEKYLNQCIHSVISQTYRNIEVILVDDGSTDSSGTICDNYAMNDSRIHVIHQDNAGAGAARNTGLKEAAGEYIAFVDSDDWLEPDAFSYMITILDQNKADVVQCGFYEEYTDRTIKYSSPAEHEQLNQLEYLRLFTQDWTCALLWGKLYRASILKDIFFETGRVIDDEFYTYQAIMNACLIVRDVKPIYHYRQRKSSVTGNPSNLERIIKDKIDYLLIRKSSISEKYPVLRNEFNKHFLTMMLLMLNDADLTLNAISTIKQVLSSEFRNCFNSGEGILVDLKIASIILSSPNRIKRKANNNKQIRSNLYE